MIIEDVYPLSPLQEGLYYHWLSAPEAYFEQINYQVGGSLDLKALEKSYQLLVARHAILRTCFTQDFGQELLQVVQKQVPSGFHYMDVSGEEDFSVERFKEMDRKAGFDLNKGSQMRLTVLGLGNSVYEFIWSHHHILMDGWCSSILIRDFYEIYRSIVQRRAPKLPKVYPYSGYIKWLSTMDKERSLKYWADYLSGYNTVSSLPRLTQSTRTDYLRKSLVFPLPDEMRQSLRLRCEEMGITENTFIQAVWGILLGRYNNTDDVLFGGVVSGRPAQLPGVEEMVGLFINTIPVRITTRDGMTVSDLLKEVHRMSIETIPHHYTQLSKIQSKSELGRGLFDHVMIFENFPVQELVEQGMEGQGDGEELSVLSYTSFDQTTYDFTLMVRTRPPFEIVLNYNGHVYDDAYMTRMQQHLLALIGQMLEQPSAPIERLDYVTSDEKQLLLQDFQGKELEYNKASTFLDLFAAQVQRVPEQAALSFENVSLTYKELDEKSNQLANYLLQEHALQPDDLVGIMVDRSDKMILALLAVQKAGAAYVPIEPDYPDSRKEFIINDTGIKALLTQSDYMFDVGYFQGGVFALDIQLDLLETPFTSPEIKVEPHHLAYVIYTSGSTGNPKGVLVEHRNLVHSTIPRLSVYSGVESFLLLSSIAFDSSVAGVFGTLAAGGRLCITRKIDVGNVAALSDYIAREQITHLLTVPSYYKLLLAELAQKENSLRQVIVAGEACPAQLVEQHHAAEALQDCELFNEYGPTEGTVWSTYHRYSRGEEFSATIGKPVPNCEVYILGNNNELLPAGVMGEICIAGGGLARGYLNRPELTAQKFVPHPFKDNARMYRTGDAGRWMRDGSIEFLGRRDDQVKIRGYRIELGEVENALRNHPSVEEAVVIAKANEDGVNELVAYIVSSETLTASDLQTYLEAHLPSYAVPSFFVPIDEVPLSANGKVDKKKLPDPKGSTLSSGTAYVAPRTEIEQCLVAVYEEVLKRQPIGIREDFFALGGDSIKSIQIVSRVKQRGYSLNIQDILLYPSIEDLATRVKAVTRQAEQGIVTGEVALSPIQHWFFDKNLPTPHHYNQSVLLLSRNPISEKAIRVVFDKLVLHHDALRMVFRKTASGWIQENKGKEQGYAFEVLTYDEATFAEHCDRIQSTINLQAGPLFKAALFRGTDGDRLLMVAHHLVIDGVSWRILFEDISTLYQQYTAGIALALPAKTDPFKYWQEKQIEYATSKKLAEEEAYWSAIESLDIKPLPQDHEGGNNTLKEAASFDTLLDKNLTERLLTQSYQAYRTEINDVLLTAFGLALEEVFGIDKVLIEMEGHGREDIDADVDVSRTVGWFTTIYPVALDMSYKNDIIRQLIEVKETLHRVPGKGIGYGVLRYLAKKNYSLTPQVSFNYLGDFGSGIKTEKGEQLFEFPGGYQGAEVPSDMQRAALLDVSGMVVSGQLRLMIRYGREQYEASTIRRLLECCQKHLVELADRLAAEERTHLTPVDLTYKQLKIEEVRTLDRELKLEDVYPVSPLQEGLYYHWLSTPEAYFEQVSYRLTGKLDKGKIEQSYHALVARHAMLRTCFREDFGHGLLQVVQKEVPSTFRYIELSAEVSVDEYKAADKRQGFNLHNGSQMRLTVVELGNDLYEFIWSHHHILMDGWCVGVLINDFYEIYGSLLQGREARLERVHPYSDYINWLSSINREQSLGYWNKYLAGYDTISTIPRTKTKEEGAFLLKHLKFSLGTSARQSMKALCEELGVTENTFMQTLWGILLGRYNNTSDTVFGTVVSGRPPEIEGVEQMIGLFINTIPVRIRVDAEKTIKEILKDVQQASIEGMSHHYTQLADIQSESQLGRDLIDHLLIFENYPVQQMVENGLAAQDSGEELKLVSSSASEHSNYDFTLVVVPGEDITILFSYNARVFDEDAMKRLQQHFGRLMQRVLEQPAKAIGSIDYLSVEEKNQVLFEFNNTAVDYPAHKTIIQLFEEQVEKTGDLIALQIEDRTLTYKELNRCANQLAACLKETYGVTPGDLAGIKLERTEWMVIATLAVLKAGAAYVPIDPQYPQDRVEYMTADSKCRLVIDEALLEKFRQEQDLYAEHNLAMNTEPDSLAYIIYTSGSTGQPKGVMARHSNLSHFFANILHRYTGKERIVMPFIASNAFDISVFHLFTPLLSGGTSVLVNKEDIQDMNRFAELLSGTTFIDTVPGVYHLLVNHILENKLEASFRGVKKVFIGGDSIPDSLLQRLSKSFTNASIVVTYGPTEGTIFCTDLVYTPGNLPPDAKGSVIGSPMGNISLYILDQQQRPVPVGVKGEICIAGHGLTKGYLNRPELTAEKYINVHLAEGFEVPVYRTGDMGRWLPDGTIEFAGRSDHQVKIRGYRIEIGEIESTLQAHAAIDSAVVAVWRNADGERELVAYLVSRDETSVSELRAYLGQQLPFYMVPDHFVQLDEMPLTSNGKIDRSRLPEPDSSGMNAGVEYVAPRNEIEEKLQTLWQQVLGKENISVKSNFFYLGGHSLKLTRLASRIHKEFAVEVELKKLFEVVVLEEQAKLIEQSNETSFAAIEPVDEQEEYALSSSQRRLWVLSQFEEANVAYNMPGVYVFEGALDRRSLEAAFESLIERHEILRTTFRENAQGGISQLVHQPEASGFSLHYFDLRSEEGRELAVKDLVQRELALPFDLAEGPLLRASLYQMEESRWVFSYVMHHIISDGWSMNILIKELLQLYAAHTKEESNPLTPLRIQYKDYAAWQQQQLSGENLEAHKNYWLKQFEGELPVLELPAGKSRPAVKTYNGNAIRLQLNGELSKGLKALSQQQGGTLFMGLVAAVNTLLYKYTGQEDIILGSPIAGRAHADLEDQIGFYLNTLALRSRFSGEQSFSELLDHVKKVTLDAYEHQVYPFDELVDALELRRDMSRSALFDVMVVLQNTGEDSDDELQKIDDLRISNYGGHETLFSKFDLTFTFSEAGEDLQLMLTYNSDIYEQAGMQQLVSHLEQLVSVIIREPLKPIQQLDYLEEKEKQQLLQDFNNTASDYPQDKTLASLFEEQVSKAPDQTALVFQDKSFTYGELNSRSNRLANYLRTNYNIQANDLVAVQLERSEWMIISLLAVLKSGGAYVPIEPGYPQERIDYIVQDSGCKLVINEEELEKFSTEEQGFESNNPAPLNHSEDLAYVIYTSGSTGRPKGCMLEHRGVVNRIAWMYDHYGYTRKDIILQKTTFTFDVSVWEIFLPLCWGMKMVLCHKDDIASPKRIASLIEEQKVSCLHFVPAMLNAFIASLSAQENMAERLQSLRLVMASGEALTPATVKDWYEMVDVPLHNLYGPTEASVDVTYYPTSAQDRIIPIGRPIWNTQMYILDSAQAPVPVGVTGEICIAGDGLARGYLNKPELTQEKFTSNPFRPGARMYKTGDLGRWLPDGNIEFLGRKDHQVKIRGYRIELGEVEHALQNHSSIKETVVVAKANEEGVNELVAYIVSSETLTASDLRSYLAKVLPAHAIPAYFVQIEKVPLTSNGKVDRKKLPDPKGSTLESGTAYVAPRTEIEKCLVAVYEEVLKRQPIGIREDFFALGGDSIKSIQIVSRMRQRGYALAIQDILLHPTIGELAVLVKSVTRQATQGIITGEIALSPVQHNFFSRDLSTPHHYNQSVLLFSQRPLAEEAIRNIFDTLVLHHDALRMVFHRTASGWVQENKGKEQGYAFEVLAYDEATFAEHCDRIQSTINLETGPLFKVALFQGSDGDRLLMVAHHLVIDGVSWRILFEDISTLYQQYTAGIAPALPAKTDSFKYWQEKQVEYASSPKLAKEEAYWSAIESLHIKPLPQDYEEGQNTVQDTSSLTSLLGEELTERLLTRMHKAYRTDVNDVLLTALGLALEEVFGIDRVLIEMEGHGREDIDADVDVSRTVGWFTTMYPVAIDLSYRNDITRQLIEVKETLHRVPNKGIGYGVLSYLAKKDYRLTPQITFNYLGDFGSGIKTDQGEQLFEFPGGYHGREVPADMPRTSLLDVSGMVMGGKLGLVIRYSREQYELATIQRLLNSCRQHLEELIDTLSAEEASHLTPIDLTYKELKIDEVSELDRRFQLEDVYPLSRLQEGLYYHWLSSPKAYLEQTGYEVKGNLDITKVEQSYQALVARHAMLRTCFREDFGHELLQVVQKVVPSTFKYIDLSGEQNVSVEAFKEADRQQGFDLGSGSQIRLTVLGLGNGLYEFIWSHHHILMDGWCVSILVSEFFEIYLSLTQGREPKLDRVYPYSNYINWLSSADRENSYRYWSDYLADYDTVSSLPRTKVKEEGEFQLKKLAFSLDASTRQSMRTLCEELGVTENTCMQAVWGILLGRYNNTNDVVFGSVVSGRPPEIEGVEKMIGLFINTIPVRIRVDAEKTTKEILKEVQQASIQGMGHHYTQLADIQAQSLLGRDLIDHLLTFENYPVQQIVEDDLAMQTDSGELSLLSSSTFDYTNYDFSILVFPGDDIHIVLGYNGRVYSDEAIKRVQQHIAGLMKNMLEQPAKAIGEIEYLVEEEKDQLLVEFTNTAADYPADKTLVDLFEEQVEKTLSNTAVAFEDEMISYKELNERANRLAAFLTKDAGLKEEDRVAILQAPGSKNIVSILGILKAGGAYVPLDSNYPEDRLLYMLEDSGASVLLADKSLIELANRLQWRSPALKQLVCIDSDNIYAERGAQNNDLERKELWEHVGEMAADAISAGGWVSSYTGEQISAEEMKEFSENAYLKLKPYLRKDMKVLEIGCSSGLTLFQVAPHVASYHGTDLSSSILRGTGKEVAEKGLTNVTLSCLSADEIDRIIDEGFDLVIMNSVIQNFNGHNYLRDVLVKTLAKMKDTGLLFIGDIMDEDRRLDLVSDLKAFGEANAGKGYLTKTDFSSELFLSRNYLDDIVAEGIGVASAEYSGKIYSIPNELTEFRFDALLKVDKQQSTTGEKKKHQYDLRHISAHNSNFRHTVKSNQLAYIIYTSGSTGRPKGVMVEHRSVVNLVLSQNREFGITPDENILQFSNLAFDASVEQIFIALASGACLTMIDKDTQMSAEKLEDIIEAKGITHIHMVPGMLELLEARNYPRLKRVIAGGDRCSKELAERWSAGYTFYNEYGPTETTVTSIELKYEGGQQSRPVLGIGHPVANTFVYILDDLLRLQPAGVAGEICIGGDGLARGYWNRPELTAVKFVENPFRPGERMYRTGDLGRWLEDGTIEFIGRKDEQVKVRGYRIELGEIEHVLQNHPAVESCVVIVKPVESGEKELVAYITAGQQLNETWLRTWLSGSLPGYMIPAHFVQLSALPFNANGKVNRKALQNMEGSALSADVEYVMPRNATEEKLVAMWQQILGKERIGVNDNFFDHGGHSLKITRLASRIHKEFNVRLELKQLFEVAVLHEQAQLIARSAKTSFVTIAPVEPQADYVLSSSQRRLWVLSQFEEANIAYNMPGVYIFDGDLDRTALEDAFASLIERHESLRTTFRENAEGEVRQLIHLPEESGFTLNYFDLCSEEGRELAVKDLVRKDFSRPFDLSSGPLLRASLYRMEESRWVFSYVMHHIISDGWSMNILLTELLQLYNAYEKGSANPLTPLRIQYKDYSVWQQQQLSGESMKLHKDYWTKQFEGEIPALELPSDKPRPAIKTYNGGEVHLRLNAELNRGLKTLGQQQNCTLFMGILASVNALLYRHTAQEDIIIGSPIAGRNHADLENQIGFYLNTLALRSRFTGEQNFRELLEQVKQTTLDAYEHHVYPFDELVDTLNLRRDLSRSPLFDVMVVLQNNERDTTKALQDINSLRVSNYNAGDAPESKFDLSFDFAEAGEELHLTLRYNRDIYASATIERMARHLEQLVSAFVREPMTPIQQLDCLDEGEKQQLLVQFNNTAADYPVHKTIVDLVEEQAAATPAATAVLFEDKTLTYAELNGRANQLANYLRTNHKIHPDDLLAVRLPRSEKLIIALLAVLKSGAAYVPIDPEYPQERIDYMTADSGCKLVIDEELMNGFMQKADEFSNENLTPSSLTSSNLAYVLYTSGSTGKPKGVMIEHRNVVAFLCWCREEFGNSDFDTVFATTSVCFDLSIFEIFFTLSIGKKLRMLPNGLAIPEYLQTSGKVLINTVPSVVGTLLSEGMDFSNVAVLNMAGEPIPASHIRQLDCERIAVRNLYGPSEDTTYSTIFRIKGEGRVLIGRPIGNTQVYITGSGGELLPVGIAGEICISGAGLARGYLNRPELTAEKFVENPFHPGERMYKTGDLGRWLPDGNIEFFGRKDHQVKIRGYRIELGEIEDALRSLEGIRASAAMVDTTAEGEKHLVAYLVSDQAIQLQELRTLLGKSLPAYMIPTRLVKLDELPLTPNGKVDRKRLPKPEGAGGGAEYVAPRNEIEEKLVQIWQDVLGREKIGVKDNFFDLGGHSIKVMQVVSRVKLVFHVLINLRNVFTEPVIESLAAHIDFLVTQNKQKQNKDDLIEIEL